MLSRIEEKQQERANFAVHTILYETDPSLIQYAWRAVNTLPINTVIREVQRYDSRYINLFLTWMMAGDLLNGIIYQTRIE